MATWKKIYTAGDDIPVGDGGTGLDAIPDGILIGNSGMTGIALGDQTLIMGDGSNEVAMTIVSPATAGTTADVNITGSTAGVRNLSIGTNVVTGGASGHLSTNTIDWSIQEATDSAKVNGIVAYANATQAAANNVPIKPGSATMVAAEGQAYVLAPPASAQVLKFDGTSITWANPVSGVQSIDVNDSSAATVSMPLTLITDTSVTTSAANKASTLSYVPSTGILSVGDITIAGITADQKITAAGNGGIGFVGIATGATKISTTTSTTNASYYPTFVGGTGTGDQVPYSHSGLSYNPAGGTGSSGLLTVPNLTVSGTTTTINSTEVEVADKALTLAVVASGVQDDAALIATTNPGINLHMTGNIGTTDENNAAITDADFSVAAQPHLRYMGSTQTLSPSGWQLGKYGSNTAAKVGGVALMTYTAGTWTAAEQVTAATTHDQGIGAFRLQSDGLYIQVS